MNYYIVIFERRSENSGSSDDFIVSMRPPLGLYGDVLVKLLAQGSAEVGRGRSSQGQQGSTEAQELCRFQLHGAALQENRKLNLQPKDLDFNNSLNNYGWSVVDYRDYSILGCLIERI